VVRTVLRYRILKRVQEEMTREEIDRKRALLVSLERSEMEARRIDQYLSGPNTPAHPTSTGVDGGSADSLKSRSVGASPITPSSAAARDRRESDDNSVDSDFPNEATPSAAQGLPSTPFAQRRAAGMAATFMTRGILGRINHAIHGIVDVDPERTRRDQIGKTRESIGHLEQALVVAHKDVKDASSGVLGDLKRFQGEKEEDLRRYMIAFARCHIEWARRTQATWEEAKAEVANIQPGDTD